MLMVLVWVEILERLLLPFVLAALGSGGAWFAVRHTNRKIDADANNIIIQSAEKLVNMQTDAVTRLEQEAASLRADLLALRSEVSVLREEGNLKSARIMVLEDHVLMLEGVVRELGGTIPPRPSVMRGT